MEQKEYLGLGSIAQLKSILDSHGSRRIFLVTGKDSYAKSGAEQELQHLLKGLEVTRHFDFRLNPGMEDAEVGISLFRKGNYDLIIAVGGGSVIDMAKLIGFLSVQEDEPLCYIRKEKEAKAMGVPFVAVPTTSGSGSESTDFAVIYVGKTKYSLAHESLLPEYCIVDPALAMSLSPRITAITGMDALVQAIESFWSVNSTEVSRKYSAEAIGLAMENLPDAVNNPSVESRVRMAKAAHLAGKAINIAKTTAAHALSYSLTSHFGIPHGQAVAVTIENVLKYNSAIAEDDCNDRRGHLYVKGIMQELYSLLGCDGPEEAGTAISSLLKEIGLETDLKRLGISVGEVGKLLEFVNYERLSNNPRRLKDTSELERLY